MLSEKKNNMLQLFFNKQEEERKDLATDLHDKLGSALASIGFLMETLGKEHPSLINSEKYTQVKQITNKAFHEVKEITLAITPTWQDYLTLEDVLRELCLRHKRINHALNIYFDFINLNNSKLDDFTNRVLYSTIQKILKLILNPLYKGNEIHIQLVIETDFLFITFEDNGNEIKPIEIEEISRNIQKINLFFDGNIDVHYTKWKGNTLDITMKYPLRFTNFD